jgi:hypothetical protein
VPPEITRRLRDFVDPDATVSEPPRKLVVQTVCSVVSVLVPIADEDFRQ